MQEIVISTWSETDARKSLEKVAKQLNEKPEFVKKSPDQIAVDVLGWFFHDPWRVGIWRQYGFRTCIGRQADINRGPRMLWTCRSPLRCGSSSGAKGYFP
jgi:hypothetical protein